ncbi:hypothetical protein E2C01_068809 [Portunus trituberculatus]|uniref:Uncharacterized protein n=1 Tax=Portunus trituberculatus TaxID=210409 RepID=A0A5B7HPT2_PORTR|nr:hypothetical protein [Portunus trituberculatus]
MKDNIIKVKLGISDAYNFVWDSNITPLIYYLLAHAFGCTLHSLTVLRFTANRNPAHSSQSPVHNPSDVCLFVCLFWETTCVSGWGDNLMLYTNNFHTNSN